MSTNVPPMRKRHEVTNAIPRPGTLVRDVKPKSAMVKSYLIYVELHTNLSKPTKVIIRRSFESQVEALEAFEREYGIWCTGDKKGVYKRQHTSKQLELAHLVKLMGEHKARDADVYGEPESAKYPGRGRIAYELIHQDDLALQSDDPKKRKCVVVCDETVFERAS
ncbi:hypothetical protein LTR05_001432 [Lithohypha guttulata]|uniref:Uncharacterized protein n=1 Tax=Lithohypha guttulata TaxID=1690604 RepID=A0AAN7T976_9EURO|nr:hypothetical protein LTR05_001432 [Lithohypha guttulata]